MAVDKEGNTVEYMALARRDRKAVLNYIKKSMVLNGIPEKINQT